MRAAEDIIAENNDLDRPSDGWETTYSYKDVIKLINEARKEAIEECAERATVTRDPLDGAQPFYYVNKKSILSLINELK